MLSTCNSSISSNSGYSGPLKGTSKICLFENSPDPQKPISWYISELLTKVISGQVKCIIKGVVLSVSTVRMILTLKYAIAYPQAAFSWKASHEVY